MGCNCGSGIPVLENGGMACFAGVCGGVCVHLRFAIVRGRIHRVQWL